MGEKIQRMSTYLLLANTILLCLILISLNLKKFKGLYRKTKRRLKKIGKMALFQLSRLVVRDKRIVIFGAGNGKLFADNPKYIYLHARKDKDVKAYWVTMNKDVYRRMKEEGYECVYGLSLEGMLTQLKAKTGVVSHSPFYDFVVGLVGGATIVNLWHGVGLKKVNYANKSSLNYRRYYHKKWHIRILQRMIKRLLDFPDYYMVSTSPAVTSYYPETFLLKKEKILELGQARNDVFFDDSLEDPNLPQYVKEKKVITYMPTHRDNGKGDDPIDDILDLNALNRFCEERDYLFLIKRHFYSRDDQLASYKHIVNIGSMDVDAQTLLKYTDILITDYSSCYTDFLLLDRPVVFYCYDYEDYVTSDREMYYDYEEVTPGPKPRTFDQLLESLDQLIQGQDEYKADRERVLNIFYSKENQGKTAEKQWQYIKKNIMKV